MEKSPQSSSPASALPQSGTSTVASNIHTTTTIILHTRHAVFLFLGRKDEDSKKRIAGLNRYAIKLKLAWADVKKGDPWANHFLLQAEEKLEVANQELKEAAAQLKRYELDGFRITQPKTSAPVTKIISSPTPYPYKVGQLIVRADALIAQILTLRHNGFIHDEDSKNLRSNVMRAVRAVLEHATRYVSSSSYAGTPDEIDSKMSMRLGRISDEARAGTIRPKFGPTPTDPAKAKMAQILFKKQNPAQPAGKPNGGNH